jgi:hypothetical protein
MAAAYVVASGKAGGRRLVRRLRSAGATSERSAKPLEPANRMEERSLARALRCGTIRRTDAGLYWVDEAKLARIRARELRFLVIALLGLVLLFGVLFILGEFP